MLTTVLLLQLCAVDVAEAREQVRTRAGIHGAFVAGLSGYSPGLGPGVSAEIGSTWADRFSFGVRATLGTIVLVGIVMGGVVLEVALSDRFSLGVTPSIAYLGGFFVEDLPASIAFMTPIRLTFAPFGRAQAEVSRRGLTLFFEAGPGATILSGASNAIGAPPSPLSVSAAIGVGYSVW